MFLSPKIWGCKYTNNFLFINKKAVFQHFGVLITLTAMAAIRSVSKVLLLRHSSHTYLDNQVTADLWSARLSCRYKWGSRHCTTPLRKSLLYDNMAWLSIDEDFSAFFFLCCQNHQCEASPFLSAESPSWKLPYSQASSRWWRMPRQQFRIKSRGPDIRKELLPPFSHSY